MRGRVARSAFALGSAGLLVLGIAGCTQSEPSEGEAAQADLKIVEQVQIDENGAEVKAAEGAAAADPAGNGQAQCPPVSIAMAGALTGPDAALGINIKNGVQLAVDKHNAANPGCQVQLKTVRHRGRPAEGHADRAADHQRRVHDRPGRARLLRRDQRHRPRVQPGRPGRGHRVGHQRDAVGEGVADLLPWPGQRRRAGAVGRQLHEEHPRLRQGVRGRRQHRLRPWPGPVGARDARPGRRLVVQYLGEEGRQGLLGRGDPGQGRQPQRGVLQRLLRRGRAVRAAAQDGGSTAHSSAPTASRIRSSSSRPAGQRRTPCCPARAARPPERSPRSTPRSSARKRAPTAPRATTWAPSC